MKMCKCLQSSSSWGRTSWHPRAVVPWAVEVCASLGFFTHIPLCLGGWVLGTPCKDLTSVCSGYLCKCSAPPWPNLAGIWAECAPALQKYKWIPFWAKTSPVCGQGSDLEPPSPLPCSPGNFLQHYLSFWCHRAPSLKMVAVLLTPHNSFRIS